jgi:hypothetical protein
MTEHDLTSALSKLADSVTEHRIGIVREIATLTANVEALQDTQEESSRRLDELFKLELACPARAGWEGTQREIGAAKKQIDKNRISVESELRALRGDATGQIDTTSPAARSIVKQSDGAPWKSIAVKALPYVLMAGVAIGAYLVSGGDEEATTRALRAVSDAVSRIDAKVEKLEENLDTDLVAASKDGD